MANLRGKNRVFVGLSGGVDSAVSAALLQREGYHTTGVFIKVWQPEWMKCGSGEERREAMRVVAHLNIPFFTLNLEDEYKKNVIDYMVREYNQGRTPNPDVMCNREIKFGAFWEWARRNGADYIATGHYARNIVKSDKGKHGYSLYSGCDKNKDQSYFLWTLKESDLSHALFPVGHLQKSEVRKLAQKFRLPNFDKKDSQGLCFMGKVDLKEFLGHYVQRREGVVLNESGEIIGKHPGAIFFTIGERHGFSLNDRTSKEAPYYVTDKDMDQNTITVSNKITGTNSLPGASKKVVIERVNWIRGNPPEIGVKISVRSRYRQPLQNAKISSINFSETEIEFESAQDTLTPGQSLVVYDSNGEECLGGGVIS